MRFTKFNFCKIILLQIITMEANLQHEDLLIKLRAKLNEDRIKLWEPPYIQADNGVSQSLQVLAEKYSIHLSINSETVLQALHELQLHSLERSKANAEFKETGLATFRVKTTVPGERPRVMKVQRKLNALGSELINAVAIEIGLSENRIKLIFSGKVVKPTVSLESQGVKNGAQIMALIMAETPDEVKEEDRRYMEMKTTREDATLLSKYVDELAEDDDEYMKLEDQSGRAVELPAAERRSLLVGLALHERGRAAAKQRDHALALVLLLEADRQLSECRSSILKTVDNWAVLQLDISWCYLCLQNLSSATDAALRLQRAEVAFNETYGENHQRLIAVKGNFANERVLFMRLYLLQGIVAYHQNKRSEAKRLFDKAEAEMTFLRVDENSVTVLMELGWSRSQARTGLRTTGGDVDRAHHFLEEKKTLKETERERHRQERQRRALGLCADGTAVSPQLVEAVVGMGYSRKLATLALRQSNNNVAEAVFIIQERRETLTEDNNTSSSEEVETPSSEDSLLEPDNRLVAELEGMGYESEDAKAALRACNNNVTVAVELLVAGGGHVSADDPTNPSTSSTTRTRKKRQKKLEDDKRKRERELALDRLSSAIRTEEDDYLDTSLVDEEEYLVQYKSLL